MDTQTDDDEPVAYKFEPDPFYARCRYVWEKAHDPEFLKQWERLTWPMNRRTARLIKARERKIRWAERRRKRAKRKRLARKRAKQ